MKTLRILLTLISLLVFAAGCSGGGGGAPTAPPPPTTDNRNEAEPNDFSAQALGALSSIDVVVSGSAASGADVDLYTVSVNATTGLQASLNWNSASDLELTISNANGVFVRHVDTAGHPEACTLSGLPAGTYLVRVGSLTNAATAYSLTLGRR